MFLSTFNLCEFYENYNFFFFCIKKTTTKSRETDPNNHKVHITIRQDQFNEDRRRPMTNNGITRDWT